MLLLDPAAVANKPELLEIPMSNDIFGSNIALSKEQYEMAIARLKLLEKRYEKLTVKFSANINENTLIYVKEDSGVIMTKTNSPTSAFVISEHNMINAFTDYMKNQV